MIQEGEGRTLPGYAMLFGMSEERKATMVSNLLVVLCSEHETQPLVNAGTLYQ